MGPGRALALNVQLPPSLPFRRQPKSRRSAERGKEEPPNDAHSTQRRADGRPLSDAWAATNGAQYRPTIGPHHSANSSSSHHPPPEDQTGVPAGGFVQSRVARCSHAVPGPSQKAREADQCGRCVSARASIRPRTASWTAITVPISSSEGRGPRSLARSPAQSTSERRIPRGGADSASQRCRSPQRSQRSRNHTSPVPGPGSAHSTISASLGWLQLGSTTPRYAPTPSGDPGAAPELRQSPTGPRTSLKSAGRRRSWARKRCCAADGHFTTEHLAGRPGDAEFVLDLLDGAAGRLQGSDPAWSRLGARSTGTSAATTPTPWRTASRRSSTSLNCGLGWRAADVCGARRSQDRPAFPAGVSRAWR